MNILPALALTLSLSAHAASPFAGDTYTAADWAAACDNTGTCRMAGYQADGDSPFSILFVRPAGAKSAVSAYLTLQEGGEAGGPEMKLVGNGGELFLNGKSLGRVKFPQEGPAKLTQGQVRALLAAYASRPPFTLEEAQGQGRIWLLPDQAFNREEWMEKGEIRLFYAQWLDMTRKDKEDGKYYNTDTLKQKRVKIFYGGRPLAEVIPDNYTTAVIPEEGRAAFQTALQRENTLELRSGKSVWQLSHDNAWAVLRFTDLYQHKDGTPHALVLRGKSNKPVPAASPAPKIRAARVPNEKAAREYAPGSASYKRLYRLIRKPYTAQDCGTMGDGDGGSIKIYPLGGGKALLETTCNTFAYNSDNFYALTDAKAQRILKVLPQGLGGYGGYVEDKKGWVTLSGSHKGRGPADCWSTKEYVWDGKEFAKSGEAADLLCKGFPGGAWNMIKYSADIIPPK
ncbi:MAG: DUF1176 domain-containing protein [Neisseria sp.]|nr:DUF1176 domain-containing protein [Neisseria sp.]